MGISEFYSDRNEQEALAKSWVHLTVRKVQASWLILKIGVQLAMSHSVAKLQPIQPWAFALQLACRPRLLVEDFAAKRVLEPLPILLQPG